MSWAALDPGISDGAAFTAVTADCRSRRAAEWDHRWGLSGESGIAFLPVGVQNGRVAPNKREGDDHRWGLSGESGIALLPVGVQNGRVAPNKREGDYQAEPTQSDIGRRNSQIGWGLFATNRPGGSAVTTGGRKL